MDKNKKTRKFFLGCTDYEFPGKKVNSVWVEINLTDDNCFYSHSSYMGFESR